MEAAARVFMQQDYSRVTTNVIADEAGMAVGTIYIYFKDKKEILLHIVGDGLERILHILKAASENAPSGSAALAAMTTGYIQYAAANPELFDVQLYFLHGAFIRTLPRERYSRIVPRLRRLGTATMTLVEEAIRRAQNEGALARSLEPRIAANVFWATINGALQIAANPELIAIGRITREEIILGALGMIREAMTPR